MITGCDSDFSTDNSDDININLAERGIDFINASANLTATAELPKFFLPQDTIVHSTGPITVERTPSIGAPTVTTSFTTDLDDATISSAGELQLQNLTHDWSRREASPEIGSFTLNSQHDWPASDMDKVTYYEDRMDQVIASAQGSSSSVNQALNNNVDSSTPLILTDATRAIGLHTEIGPEPWVDGVLRGYVLMERRVTYTVTSTNQDLISNNQVSGTFEYRDRWGLITLLSVETVGQNAVFDQISLLCVKTPTFILFDTINTETGTFTLSIN